MPSAVDICNTALAHVGAEQLVTSIDPPDGSVEAGLCKTFYPIARRAALEESAWTFARTRAELAPVANPSTVWAYAYAMPADCIKARRVLPLQTLDMFDGPALSGDFTWPSVDDLFSERGSVNFEIEGGVLLTNEPEAVLLYTRDVTDTSKFTPMFSRALGMLLAGYLAGPLIKGREGISVGNSWAQAGQNALSQAAASDANASSERAEFIPQSIRARE